MRKVSLLFSLGLVLPACDSDASRMAAADAGGVTDLPLQPGFYVSTDTPCESASNATLLLKRRDGLGGARDFCRFTAIA